MCALPTSISSPFYSTTTCDSILPKNAEPKVVKQGLKKVHADIFLFHAKSIGAYLHIIRANYYGADNKVKDTIHHFILQKLENLFP